MSIKVTPINPPERMTLGGTYSNIYDAKIDVLGITWYRVFGGRIGSESAEIFIGDIPGEVYFRVDNPPSLEGFIRIVRDKLGFQLEMSDSHKRLHENALKQIESGRKLLLRAAKEIKKLS